MHSEVIKSKLEYEYERFYMECMCLSKPGIFAKSSEIELKKSLTNILKERADKEESFPETLTVLDNILEDAYRYVQDHQDTAAKLEELVDKWALSVVRNRPGSRSLAV
ncbi:hypothetical protein [Mediterraneibacter agrestimuris]|uniref:hypothetical protein n=1 Tax=Mediterraneibacter agrestimuris TaxID=2941333 RepID=UPI00203D4AD5|nr:hypothetical protein [Mediterraneibacter agrestimuris]